LELVFPYLKALQYLSMVAKEVDPHDIEPSL
ncbi:unnamed protein product, partial [marine sediment metagenome]